MMLNFTLLGYELANPEYLFGLLVLAPMIIWYVLKDHKAQASIQVSSLSGVEKAKTSFKEYFRHVLFGLRLLAIALLVYCLARPQTTDKWKETNTKGIDIVIAVDVSTSMDAMDLKPNRLEAAKEVAQDFIKGRTNDRVGLVIYGGEGFTQCPLTIDHDILINLFGDIKTGTLKEGTAIGSGLGVAINRLKDSKAISKVIILLTDGRNNVGDLPPLTAAEIAKTFGIRVYTIGIGTKGKAPYPAKDFWGRPTVQHIKIEIDDALLKQIAQITGAKYFRATDNEKLREIYNEIDRLEKTKFELRSYSKKNEEFRIFAIIAGCILLFEILMRLTIVRNIP